MGVVNLPYDSGSALASQRSQSVAAQSGKRAEEK